MVQVTISNETGLHARPAASFCIEAKKYDASINVIKGDGSFNAKSVISIMSASIDCGDQITIDAKGNDAGIAEKKLAEFLATLEG